VGAWLGMAGFARAQYSIVDLGDLGAGYARAWAINGLGQVAGDALLPGAGTVDRAVMWQAGSLTDLGTLGGQQSAALGINNAGTVCGWAQTASGNTLPALWNGSAVTALPTLGGASGTASGINDAGTAVGYSYLAAGSSHATLWSGGGVRDLGTLGGAYSVAYDINNSGEAVGTASDSSGRDRAVLWGPGGATDLGGLSGGQWTAAPAVNDSGQVILWGTPLGATDDRAAFWNGNPSSPVISLGTFGGSQSWAYGLNDHGFVVGSADEPGGTYHAFAWDGTEMVDLGTLGGYYSSAYAINDQGIIVGFALDAFGQTHAVEWVPVPEPAALLLGLFGGGLVGLWATRRSLPGVAAPLTDRT
jgi:probable HAF family extracellular repeat protein